MLRATGSNARAPIEYLLPACPSNLRNKAAETLNLSAIRCATHREPAAIGIRMANKSLLTILNGKLA